MAQNDSIMSDSTPPPPSLFQSILPILTLVGLLGGSVWLFADDSSYGPNQIALILSGMVAAIIGMRNGWRWADLQEGMVHGVSLSMGAIFILLVVGALIGTWILSGIVPTLIYYGLQILNPSIFFAASLIICAVVSLATGSSWTTVSTMGVALIGVAAVMDISLPMTAGAIISGAYFGDKLSPLSDTTNLAPAMAGADLFAHIRHMLWTTIPSFIVALVLFGLLGISLKSGVTPEKLTQMQEVLKQEFVIGPHLLLIPAVIFYLIARKTPAFPALLIGALAGSVAAVIFQPAAVLKYVGAEGLSNGAALLKGAWQALFAGFKLESSNESLNELLTRGGMASMLNTCWLVISAMIFGSVMEKTGKLRVLATAILRSARSDGSLVAATIGASVGTNIVTADQYMAIVLPGRMFREAYAARGLQPKNLSRALEDAGTLTSPLVPWNTCGAFMAGALGVSTIAYLPFCFLNLLNPLLSIAYGYTGFTMEKIKSETETPPN